MFFDGLQDGLVHILDADARSAQTSVCALGTRAPRLGCKETRLTRSN
jgi:hypothetical protein